MRNLKKILAMVLALVMSLSLMATAGASSFPDVDDSNPYATAIEVLDELKVFQGFDDGTFKPTDTLDRAQAAVLVYRIATGDVENKYLDNYTYMQQSKFTDLDGYNWAKGYINYCQNAGIVVGTSATTFDPGVKVTGYQLLVMLLRTLGYGKAGEFADPKGWELQTAAIAEREGILKNVTTGDFGAPAPRQMVAEILFQGLLHDTVEYSALTPGGYTRSGVILGKNVGLEEITGVVTANEIADLDDTTPLEAGKTRLEAEDGRIYTLDVPSAATDIGETRHAYIQNGTKVLGVLADTGDNRINDNPGVGTTLSKVVKDMNVRLTDETQYYINFGDSEQYACERRLEYNVTFDNSVTIDGKTAQEWFEAEYGVKVADVIDNKNALDEVKGTSYTRVIPAEKNITEDDLAIMRGIFSVADGDNQANDISLGITGYVFAGTNSANAVERNKDLSEDISWREFYRDYINSAAYNISGSDNGEWFKVIDNDNDGNVDYVLLTRFVMTTITDYNNRTGYYTTEWTSESEEGDHTKFLDIHKDDIVSVDGEDLAIDDVILYAKIDGKYYVDHPDTVDTSITKFTYKTDTITCADEQDRVWSGIDKEAAAFFEEITDPEMETKRPYTLYLDHFGYVRLVTDTSKGFVLLTDGYYETDRRNATMKATVYDLASESLEDVTVVKDAGESAYYFQDDGNTAQFGYIDDWEWDHNGNRGTWERLSTFGMYRYGQVYWDSLNEEWVHDSTKAPYYDHYDASNDIFETNVALASVDGGEYSLSDIGANNSRSTEYRSYQLSENFADFSGKALNLTGIVDWNSDGTVGNTVRINTTSNTRYYWVSLDKDNNTVVQTWLGSSNAPDGFSAERGYAITSTVTSVNEDAANYEIAQVVVFEGEQTSTDYKAMIPYAYAANKRYQGLGWDREGYSDESKVDNKTANAANLLNSVYDMDGNKITENYGRYGVWAGYVVTSRDTNRDYYQFSRSESLIELHDGYAASEPPAAVYTPGEVDKAYRVIDKKTGSLGGYATDTADLKLGEKVIYFVDGKNNVQLVINVDESTANDINLALRFLWSAIVEDYAGYKVATVKQMFGGVELGRVPAPVSNGVANFDMSDFNLDGYNWGGTKAAVVGASGIKEVIDNTTLRISDLKGGEVFTIEYTKDAGRLTEGDNGPVILENNGGMDGSKPVYTNFELREEDKAPQLKAIDTNDGKLELGEGASLYFDMLANHKMGVITINGVAVASDDIVKITDGSLIPTDTDYDKFKVNFTMPAADESAVVIVLGETSVKADEPVAPDVIVNSKGEATATPDVDAVKDAITGSPEGNVTITVEQPEGQTEIKSSTVTLTPEVVDAVTDSGADVTVETPQGSVTLPVSAIEEAIGSETVESVEIIIAKAETEAEVPAGSVVVDVTVKVNGDAAELTDLEDEISITLPYRGEEDTVDVYYVNGDNELVLVKENVAVRDGAVTFTVDHLTVFAVAAATALDDAKAYAKASLDAYVNWAKEHVDLESQWFTDEGVIITGDGDQTGASYEAGGNTTWCDDLTNPAMICQLNLESGIAEIKAMIDRAETVEDATAIFTAARKDSDGNPVGGFDCMAWDATDLTGSFCKKFGYTGNLISFIDEQIQLMLVEAAILEENESADFSKAVCDALPEENVNDSNRATHWMAAAIRGLYAVVADAEDVAAD